MVFGDTGFHALQFADRIFNFSEIYIVGLDYMTHGNSYHFDEEESDPEKVKKFKEWSIDVVLDRYNDIQWRNNIYNCNKKSKLSLFPYGLPY